MSLGAGCPDSELAIRTIELKLTEEEVNEIIKHGLKKLYSNWSDKERAQEIVKNIYLERCGVWRMKPDEEFDVFDN
jgi:hypothetical protein